MRRNLTVLQRLDVNGSPQRRGPEAWIISGGKLYMFGQVKIKDMARQDPRWFTRTVLKAHDKWRPKNWRDSQSRLAQPGKAGHEARLLEAVRDLKAGRAARVFVPDSKGGLVRSEVTRAPGGAGHGARSVTPEMTTG